jgi:hypothetical protein
MGRASRMKRERRLTTVGDLRAVPKLLTQHGPSRRPVQDSPHKVYRFFKEPTHADALTSGTVWLSTLEACRAYEDPYQGDPDEAVQRYKSGHAVGGSDDDAAFKLIAERSGIFIGPGCSNNTVSNCSAVQRLPDAFVLCTTEKFNPESLSDTFGRHCVEIERPQEFFQLLTANLSKLHDVSAAAFGRVIYRERSYTGLQNPPGPIGFVKPPDKYKSQREVRFLWTSLTGTPLAPFALYAPECAALCKRIA